MTWFLARMRVVVRRYPGWQDDVTVETWPAELDPPFAIRDFRLFDDRREEIAVASTSWLLMDLARRRPMRRVPAEILDLHPETPVRALPEHPCRLPRPRDMTRREPVRVRQADLDVNEHVNHVFYVAQVEQSVAADTRKSCQVAELDIEFKAECHLGDETIPCVEGIEEEKQAFLHSLVRRRDAKEVVRARTRWTAAAGGQAPPADPAAKSGGA